MTDDDLVNLILGNDSGAPSATQFAGGTGQGGTSGGSILDSWKSTGLGGDTLATFLPQLGNASAPSPLAGTSAALLSPSALQPPSALYDPNPPPPTVDQLAAMVGMSPQDVAATRGLAENQVRGADIAGDLAAPVMDAVLPEFGILDAAGNTILSGNKLVSGAIDVLNNQAALTAPQREEAAGDQAIFQRLNDLLAQPLSSPNIPPASRAFPW